MQIKGFPDTHFLRICYLFLHKEVIVSIAFSDQAAVKTAALIALRLRSAVVGNLDRFCAKAGSNGHLVENRLVEHFVVE